MFVNDCERKTVLGTEVAVRIFADVSDTIGARQFSVPFAPCASSDLLWPHRGTAPWAAQHDELVDTLPGLKVSECFHGSVFGVGSNLSPTHKPMEKRSDPSRPESCRRIISHAQIRDAAR